MFFLDMGVFADVFSAERYLLLGLLILRLNTCIHMCLAGLMSPLFEIGIDAGR